MNASGSPIMHTLAFVIELHDGRITDQRRTHGRREAPVRSENKQED